MNITEKIKSNLAKMTKSEYAVAIYFLENTNDFAFMTLDAIASKINTSTTTVLRFCRRNGFNGYKVFQDEVRANFKYKFTLPDKFRMANEVPDRDSLHFYTVQNSIDCINKTFTAISESQIALAVDTIVKAQRVFCFGMRESYALSHYAYTRFLSLRDNVQLLTAGYNGEIESLLNLKKGDVCIFYLFHRYTNQSCRILEYVKMQGADVILITDPPYDEVEKYATILLPCFVDISGIKNSASAPVCVTDCLCNAVVSNSGYKTLQYMKKSEELFKKFTFGENE